MPELYEDDGRQLVLDFGPMPTEDGDGPGRKPSNVISFSAFVRPARSLFEPSPAIERLLLEAKRLRW